MNKNVEKQIYRIVNNLQPSTGLLIGFLIFERHMDKKY
jgi:hypothetical protein